MLSQEDVHRAHAESTGAAGEDRVGRHPGPHLSEERNQPEELPAGQENQFLCWRNRSSPLFRSHLCYPGDTVFQPLLQLVMGAASGHIPEEKLVALYLLSPFPWLGMGAARWPGPGCPCTEEPVAAPDGPGGGTAHWVEPVVPAQQML